MNRDAVADHVHQLHLADISSGAVASTFERSLVFPLQRLLNPEIVFDEVVEVVLVE